MPELLEEKRENWGSRGGFILAAVGSAVGLGNLWGFPYKIYSYGGGAFLIPYILAMFCIGIPMLILEFSLGHLTQRAAPDAFKTVNRKTEIIGWWGIILGFVIITYYPVILAYCLSFIYYSFCGVFNGSVLPWGGHGIEGVENAKTFFFDKYLGYTEGCSLGHIRPNILFTLVLSWVFMYLCIFKGVNLVSKIVWLTVPLPWLMLIILTVRGLTLPGSVKGLVYYLDPVWTELAKPSTWRFAFGQVFFSLSLAFGVMITYASFLHKKSDLNNNATIIGLADFATSFIAGLAIFSTLGAMSYVTEQSGSPVPVEKIVSGGPGLAFVAFPYALAQLPGAPWWSLIFFSTLITLGIDSAFSITESVLAGIVDKTGWKRSLVLPVMSLVGLAFGLFYATQGGLNWLGTIDGFINGTWGIAFLGLLECVVLGWAYRIDNLRLHANERSDWQLSRWWNYSIRIFIPIVLGTLFLWNLYDDLNAKAGFLLTPEGNWIIPNCVGIGVVAIAPVIAMILSLLKNVKRENDQKEQNENVMEKDYPLENKGRLAFGLSLISMGMLGLVIVYSQIVFHELLLFSALALAVIAIIISNSILEKYDRDEINISLWPARLGGVISTLDISIFLTVKLVQITKQTQVPDQIFKTKEHLSGVSYVILSAALLLIILGLGWCFYKALTAQNANSTEE